MQNAANDVYDKVADQRLFHNVSSGFTVDESTAPWLRYNGWIYFLLKHSTYLYPYKTVNLQNEHLVTCEVVVEVERFWFLRPARM